MYAILFRDPQAPPSNDWRWRLVSGSRIVASGQPHASPSKAFRAVSAIVRGVVREIHAPVVTFHRETLKDGAVRVTWS